MNNVASIFYVALGGAMGSVIRFLVSKWIQESTGSLFPLGTFAVNIIGCLMIGLLSGIADKYGIGGEMKLLLTVGLCGGFTTFSTFVNENLQLLRTDHLLLTALYAGLSVTVGLLSAWLGRSII